MTTPVDRYLQDPEFHRLVDHMEAMIHQGNFTPSEMRQAAVLASINYEMKRVDRRIIIDPKIEEALQTLENAEIKP